jgi:hypothetical protein
MQVVSAEQAVELRFKRISAPGLEDRQVAARSGCAG